jgi:hypothetical protein
MGVEGVLWGYFLCMFMSGESMSSIWMEAG